MHGFHIAIVWTCIFDVVSEAASPKWVSGFLHCQSHFTALHLYTQTTVCSRGWGTSQSPNEIKNKVITFNVGFNQPLLMWRVYEDAAQGISSAPLTLSLLNIIIVGLLLIEIKARVAANICLVGLQLQIVFFQCNLIYYRDKCWLS